MWRERAELIQIERGRAGLPYLVMLDDLQPRNMERNILQQERLFGRASNPAGLSVSKVVDTFTVVQSNPLLVELLGGQYPLYATQYYFTLWRAREGACSFHMPSHKAAIATFNRQTGLMAYVGWNYGHPE